MSNFEDPSLTLEDQWRAIILFGRNAASYKFALGRALLQLGKAPDELIRLDELAVPYSAEIARHLQHADKQATSPSSQFLDACRGFNRGDLDRDALTDKTVQLGFNDVIDAFHVVGQSDVPDRFFLDERKESGGIRLTDAFFQLQEREQRVDLPQEIEARWRLVEAAWELNVSRNLVAVDVDHDLHHLVIGNTNRRRAITSCRDALNGYQKGQCFYCYDRISVVAGSARLADVDHFLPHVLKSHGFGDAVDGVWNLVLACRECNRGAGGKGDRVPTTRLLARLNFRNEYLIESHHPLRETLIRQTAGTEERRRQYLQEQYQRARKLLIHDWEPEPRDRPRF